MAIKSKWRWKPSPLKPAPVVDGDVVQAAAYLRVSEDELREVTALLCAGVPTGIAIRPKWVMSGNHCELRVDHPECRIYQEFAWTEDDGLTVGFEALVLASHVQNQGISGEMVRNCMIAYDHLGVTYASAYANFDIGGYVWAKLGGMATVPAVCRQELLELVGAKTAAGAFKPGHARALERIVRETPSDRLMFEVASAVSEDLPPVLLGKELLLGYKWDALWDLTDQNQRARTEGAL